MVYTLRWYPVFNQWSPCSVSLHSDQAVSCRRPCSGPVDAQRLSRLRRFLRWCSSINGYLIEWLMPFASVRHSTNGHRTVFHRILTRQCRVDACVLARWMCSVFCAFTFPTLVLFHQRLLDRMAYALHWCPAFNQWSPCSVSPHSAPAVLYRCPCPSPVDAQRLLRLRHSMRWCSSTSGYPIK